MAKKIYIIAGGTFVDVAPHFSFAARAFGQVGIDLCDAFCAQDLEGFRVIPIFTAMAGQGWARISEGDRQVAQSVLDDAGLRGGIVTNDDLLQFVRHLKTIDRTKVIVMATAVCDWKPNGLSDETGEGRFRHEFGRKTKRLKTRRPDGQPNVVSMDLVPTDKIIAEIRTGKDARKDIFVVGFKTTASFTQNEQYTAALGMMKENSLNLVLANDIDTHCNMIVTPEEARYPARIQNPAAPAPRSVVLNFLAKMTLSRCQGTFTRSSVVGTEADLVPWHDERIPQNLREVVDWCIANGAYKPFKGKTVGHFATKVDATHFLTSVRKSNFNTDLHAHGLVEIETVGNDRVIAKGKRPSVGGQSQRKIYEDNPDADCIVHFHCPIKECSIVNTVEQWPYECGSHQCGENTSQGLRQHGALRAVNLNNHGPNIVFSKDVPSAVVIKFIRDNFDLSQKTGGLFT